MRYRKMFPALLGFTALLFLAGIALEPDRSRIIPGLIKIALTEDSLITDYVALAGVGAAFINAAVITAVSILILYFTKEPPNGYTLAEIGIMSGFSLFGKNPLNIWPIFFGVWLYAKSRREPFSKYASVALLATALSPVVSFVSLSGGWEGPGVGILLGIGMGFVLPSLSAYTYKIQNGMNLYNMGFACGVLAMILVPVMISLGKSPTTAYYWAVGYNLPFGIMLTLLCLGLILTGFFFCNRPPWAAWAGYRLLLQHSGRAPSDFLRMYGAAPVLINMGTNGLISMTFLLVAGGDLNGPTLGGIFTVMGFSAFGKHSRNITPVMLGVALGGLIMQWNLNDSALQLASLFCTTLAPISGYFGWPYGILAGFLHSCVVLFAGTPVAGLNLYNNGFSGGLVAIFLYPTITAIARHHRLVVQEADYFDNFEHDEPLYPTQVNGNMQEEWEISESARHRKGNRKE